MEIILYCLATAVVTFVMVMFYASYSRSKLVQSLSDATHALRNLEKQIHLKETGLIRDKNKFEADINSEMQASLSKAKQEGVLLGRSDAEKDHKIEIKNLELAHREHISKERAAASEEAKAALRLELEQQVKLFSIKISPFVKIKKGSGWIFNTHLSETGYQYQLLVNGIPALHPHITIERSEEVKELDEAKLQKLLETATTLAKAAADTYLAGSGKGAVQITEPILDMFEKHKPQQD